MHRRVLVAEVRSFVERCMVSVGTDPKHGAALSQVLTEADVRGHFTHGLNRLEIYIRDIKNGITQPKGEPSIEKDFAASALVDGNNLLGPVVGNFCMDLAIKKAKEYGIGWIACKGSTHFGIAAWYSGQALQHGMIGMSMTNTSPVVVPTKAAKPSIGTNPLSVAAPGKDGDSFLLDMAVSAVAYGKLELCRLKGTEMPQGWGVDSKGSETVDPEKALKEGGLLPLGGKEITGGYKGFGLAMMVDVFCGILSGSEFGTNIKRWQGEEERVQNLGQCFVAINPKVYADGFEDRMQALMDQYRNLEPAEGETAVLVAGDPEREHMRKVRQDGAIHYHVNLLQNMDQIADRLGVEHLPTL
ncbi:unnamed protein product [Pocillopora meandrina]|uniref:Malate dehydrogenase n=1 Tax=Pocillopora meandrina TaxID=46732 RepID=A0AAU9WI65_9CNID|nr:unnamed protein product [Pocillopora meandrina]